MTVQISLRHISITLLIISGLTTRSDLMGQANNTAASWIWDSNLDALKAAKENHKIVFEDDKVRILQVICPPGEEEPVHTHRYPSVMWVTAAGQLTYYNYKYNEAHVLVKTDSFTIKQRQPDKLNIGESMEPEGPHAVKNTGTTLYIGYRVEYKIKPEN